MAPDLLTLAAASGSDGGLGKIGTIPVTSGVLYVRCPCGPETEKLDWIIKCDRNATWQLYRALTIVDTATLTLSSLADTETIIINGLTFTAETTEEDALASARKFFASGDNADAVALAALINDATYGVPGVLASASTNVVTLTPDTTDPKAYLLQPVTGTAAGHCAVAVGTLASLIRDGSATSYTAVTTDSGVVLSQTVNGWDHAYLGISAPAAGAATVVVKAARYRYRD